MYISSYKAAFFMGHDMATVMNQLPDYDITVDMSTNPEIILLTAEDDEPGCSVLESLWVSGMAVTKPKQSNYDKE
jgi:hypothetical protein